MHRPARHAPRRLPLLLLLLLLPLGFVPGLSRAQSSVSLDIYDTAWSGSRTETAYFYVVNNTPYELIIHGGADAGGISGGVSTTTDVSIPRYGAYAFPRVSLAEARSGSLLVQVNRSHATGEPWFLNLVIAASRDGTSSQWTFTPGGGGGASFTLGPINNGLKPLPKSASGACAFYNESYATFFSDQLYVTFSAPRNYDKTSQEAVRPMVLQFSQNRPGAYDSSSCRTCCLAPAN